MTTLATLARRLTGSLLVVLWAAAAVLPGQAAALTADEVRAKIQESYKVRVLRVEATKHGDAEAFWVYVMKPGGNYNDAFAVVRLLVDAASGDLISPFKHRSDGYDNRGARAHETNRNDGRPDGPNWR